jgi:hypothetical protein
LQVPYERVFADRGRNGLRGEVALIVEQKGIDVGILSEAYFAPVVIMVLVTTLFLSDFIKSFI